MNSTILNTAERAINNITAVFDRPVNQQFLSLENPVFGTFMFWTALLALKMMALSVITIYFVLSFKGKNGEPNLVAERYRNAHRNDLENILPYFTIGLLYVCVNPPPLLATILFRVATIIRFFHTFVQAIYPIPQPARVTCFGIHYLITIYMIIHIMVVAIKFI